MMINVYNNQSSATGCNFRYTRHDEALSPDDLQDLRSFFEALRSFYDIPADAPVFEKRRQESNSARALAKAQPTRAAGRNRADHPWRNSL